MYRGKDCMKKFCELLRDHAIKIINFKKKKMKLSPKELEGSFESAKNYCKVRDHCHHKGNIEVLHI